MCGAWLRKKEDELKTEQWKTIIGQFKEIGIKEIHFTGGEPLLRNDLTMLVRHCSALGLSVGLTTNGILLEEVLLKGLVEAGVYSIAVSLDALGERYDQIRGAAGSYLVLEKALAALSAYHSAKKVRGSINFTLMKLSISEFYGVKKLADRLRLPVAINLLDDSPYLFKEKHNRKEYWFGPESMDAIDSLLIFLRNEKEKNPSSLLISLSAINYIGDYFSESAVKRVPCIASQDRIFVGPDGDVFGGCLSMGAFGNVKKTGLQRMLLDRPLREAHRNMFYKNCPGCSCGYLFNIQHCIPFAMSDMIKTGGAVRCHV